MRYFKFTCENGYCGCDEEFYREFEDGVTENEIYAEGDDILVNEYTGFYDWSQCILENVEDYDSEEEYEEAIEEYQAECTYWFEEISEEEYKEHN